MSELSNIDQRIKDLNKDMRRLVRSKDILVSKIKWSRSLERKKRLEIDLIALKKSIQDKQYEIDKAMKEKMLLGKKSWS